ncbi:MAG: hypothetical protein II797_00125 [Clostridia bacterium]|nr:hypothetical protein [Clostridia bacterium]
MEREETVLLHEILGESPVGICLPGGWKADLPQMDYLRRENGWEWFAQSSFVLRRKAERIGDRLYRLTTVWENTGEETSFVPVVIASSYDRYIRLEIPQKNGIWERYDPEYGAFPELLPADRFVLPALSVSRTYLLDFAVFTPEKGSVGCFTSGWEGQGRHWVLFPETTLKKGEKTEKTVFIVILPSEGEGGKAILQAARDVLEGRRP